MSAASVLSQLRSLVEKSNHLILKFERIYPTEEQWDTLRDMSTKLATTATTIQERIRALEKSRADRAWKESEELRSHALACKGDILANGRLKQSPVFRRNIVTVFDGPKDSKFDTDDAKIRKATTRQRCAQIRLLSPDGIISWAIAFAPSLWAGGSMATDIFKCLLDDVEPDRRLSWPLVVRKTLHTLLEDEEALQNSIEYRSLLKGKFAEPWKQPEELTVQHTILRQRIVWRAIESGSGLEIMTNRLRLGAQEVLKATTTAFYVPNSCHRRSECARRD